jgi:hypothetical protein
MHGVSTYKTMLDRWMKQNPGATEIPVQMLQRQAASFTNKVFGGLTFADHGRSRTTLDALRVVALAPDWVESNVRSVTGTIFGKDVDPATGQAVDPRFMYRQYQTANLVGAMMVNVVANSVIAAAYGNQLPELEHASAWAKIKDSSKFLTHVVVPNPQNKNLPLLFNTMGPLAYVAGIVTDPGQWILWKQSHILGGTLRTLQGQDFAGRPVPRSEAFLDAALPLPMGVAKIHREKARGLGLDALIYKSALFGMTTAFHRSSAYPYEFDTRVSIAVRRSQDHLATITNLNGLLGKPGISDLEKKYYTHKIAAETKQQEEEILDVIHEAKNTRNGLMVLKRRLNKEMLNKYGIPIEELK